MKLLIIILLALLMLWATPIIAIAVVECDGIHLKTGQTFGCREVEQEKDKTTYQVNIELQFNSLTMAQYEMLWIKFKEILKNKPCKSKITMKKNGNGGIVITPDTGNNWYTLDVN